MWQGPQHSLGQETGVWGGLWDHCHRNLRHQEGLKNEESEIWVAIFILDEVKLIMESLKLEKTFKIIKANFDLIPPMPMKPHHKMSHPLGFWALPGMWFHPCPEQPVLILDLFFHEEIFPNIQPESPLVHLEVGPHSTSAPGTEGSVSQGCIISFLCLLSLSRLLELCPASSPATSSSTILKGENRPKLC